jgi:EAL domain-containing protein (putative c-di-GMP-specific phosphodiesterase class I)
VAIERPHLPAVEATPAELTLQAIDCRLSERAHQLHRLLAAEQAACSNAAKLLFLKLQPAEVGADSLPESLARLQHIVGNKRIVAEIPDSAVVDIPYFRAFLARLRELDLEVAYDGFTGGQHQVKSQREFAPTYLKLAPALARGVDRSSQRQQLIRDLAAAAADIGAQLIAAGIHSENEAQTCRELGCRLAQGDHYGRPQTIDWPLEGWGLSV